MDVLEFLKDNHRIDGESEEQYLKTLINAAKELLIEAGVTESESELYKLTVAKISTEWYLNRETNEKLSLGIVGMINQLRYKEGAN